MEKFKKVCRNKKTGKKYVILSENMTNATNDVDGQQMVLYIRKGEIIGREKKEFYEKFNVIGAIRE